MNKNDTEFKWIDTPNHHTEIYNCPFEEEWTEETLFDQILIHRNLILGRIAIRNLTHRNSSVGVREAHFSITPFIEMKTITHWVMMCYTEGYHSKLNIIDCEKARTEFIINEITENIIKYFSEFTKILDNLSEVSFLLLSSVLKELEKNVITIFSFIPKKELESFLVAIDSRLEKI